MASLYQSHAIILVVCIHIAHGYAIIIQRSAGRVESITLPCSQVYITCTLFHENSLKKARKHNVNYYQILKFIPCMTCDFSSPWLTIYHYIHLENAKATEAVQEQPSGRVYNNPERPSITPHEPGEVTACKGFYGPTGITHRACR